MCDAQIRGALHANDTLEFYEFHGLVCLVQLLLLGSFLLCFGFGFLCFDLGLLIVCRAVDFD